MEVRAVLGLHDDEAIGDAMHGRYLGVFGLRQAGHTGVAALRAAHLFVPLIGHWDFSRPLDSEPIRGCSKPNTQINSNGPL
jgi:hypothetical protein